MSYFISLKSKKNVKLIYSIFNALIFLGKVMPVIIFSLKEILLSFLIECTSEEYF